MAETVVNLKPIEATPESFKEYGQVIEPSPDGDEFGPQDAQLDLTQGIPRFYIMHLQDRPLYFSNITHHASVTQCLGSITGGVWYLGLAKPSVLDSKEKKEEDCDNDILQSPCGHFYVSPAVDEVRIFRISGPKFVKLEKGTWHAGPLFKGDSMDFYNLELNNTNGNDLYLGSRRIWQHLRFESDDSKLKIAGQVVDHTKHDFKEQNGVVFLVEE